METTLRPHQRSCHRFAIGRTRNTHRRDEHTRPVQENRPQTAQICEKDSQRGGAGCGGCRGVVAWFLCARAIDFADTPCASAYARSAYGRLAALLCAEGTYARRLWNRMARVRRAR